MCTCACSAPQKSCRVRHACTRFVGATILTEHLATRALWRLSPCAIACLWAPPRRVLQFPPSVHHMCMLGTLPSLRRQHHACQPCPKVENQPQHGNRGSSLILWAKNPLLELLIFSLKLDFNVLTTPIN